MLPLTISGNGMMMAEVADHGQKLALRTRRGADFKLELELTGPDDSPFDLTDATVASRIFATDPGTRVSAVDAPSALQTYLAANPATPLATKFAIVEESTIGWYSISSIQSTTPPTYG